MKIVITADWHFGYPGRLNDLKWAFISLVDYCVDNNIKLILMLGDLTHDREHMTHDVSNTLSECLDYMYEKNISMITLIGNHDMFMRHKWSINAIKPFAKQMTCVDCVSNFELSGRKFWMVPFIEHEPSYMKIVNQISDMSSEEDILLTHIGINAATLNVCFLVQNWNIVNFEKTKFSRVYSGHFHCTQKVGEKSWYPGSPIPFKFDEGQVEHGFFVYDIEENSHKFVDIYDIGKEDDDKPSDFITAPSDDIINIIGSCDGNNVKIQLKDGDDKSEISKKLIDAGASKVVFIAPKEETPNFTKKGDTYARSNSVFKSWLKHDDPKHLNHELLMGLEKEIRSETRIIEDD